MTDAYKVFQRAGTSNWWVRFTIKGEGHVRKSLETTDEQLAQKLAAKLYHEAVYRSENGMRAMQRSFSVVAEEFIAHMESLAASGEKYHDKGARVAGVVRRYFIPYFGDKAIDAITDADCFRYLEWRKAFWTTGPGSEVQWIEYKRKGKLLRRPCTDLKRGSSLSTQRSEAVVLRQLFAQAARWGYLNKSLVPEVKLSKAEPSPRPSFTLDELQRLLVLADQRANERGVHPAVKRDRRILRNYVTIAATTGMRPTEIRNLTWGDVLGYSAGLGSKLKDRDIRIRCRGKSKHRTFIPQEGALAAFDDLWLMQDPRPTPEQLVFAHRKLNKSLTALLDAAGLLYDHRGKKRDSYSFRHAYISAQIRAGVDVFVLARNCGTSPMMIDQFYAQVDVEQFKDALRPQWAA